jgi:hypothetical protein
MDYELESEEALFSGGKKTLKSEGSDNSFKEKKWTMN